MHEFRLTGSYLQWHGSWDAQLTGYNDSEALSKLLLHQYIDDSEILDRYNCRLCGFGCGSEVKFLEHLESTHAASMSKQRAMVEYRKKVLGMSAFAGPTVAWTMVLSTFWYSVVCLLHEKKPYSEVW